MINTSRHVALLEVANRTGKSLGWLQRQAIEGAIPAVRDPEHGGWLVLRDDAEAMVLRWRPT